MQQKHYDIIIQLLENKWIKKVIICSDSVKLELWFRNFGNVSLDDRKTRDVFAGIMQGLMGVIEDQIPEMHVTVERKKAGKRRTLVGTTAEFLKLLHETLNS